MDRSASAKVTAFLDRNNLALNLWAVFAAFTAYFCMYAFRKPFAAGTFEGQVDMGGGFQVDYKIVLIIAQVFGYTLSKFAGIKVISEMKPHQRAWALLGMIGVAEGALVLFALTPAPYNAFWLFVNGTPLGMIWGLVFGYLEGRRTTEALGAGLSASYILASGWVKSLGKWLLLQGVSEFWMPALAGAVFFLPLLLSVWMLKVLPPPSAEDVAARTKREPMDGAARSRFFWHFAPGLIALTSLHILMTAYRDFRDNFAAEIWNALGYGDAPAILGMAEIPVALGVLAALGLLFLIKDNRMGLLGVQVVQLFGCALVFSTTFAYRQGVLDPAWWMILVGVGLYLTYVPFGSALFDRLIAASGVVANAGFMIYVTDAFGYLGSVFLLLYKNFGQKNLSWLEFFVDFSYAASGLGMILGLSSLLYFWWRTQDHIIAAKAA